MVPIIWLALIGAIYSRIAPFFALNRIFFPANEEATLKTKQPIRFQGLFKVTWINLILNRLRTASIKYLNWPSPVFGRFQNGCNFKLFAIFSFHWLVTNWLFSQSITALQNRCPFLTVIEVHTEAINLIVPKCLRGHHLYTSQRLLF